MFKEKLQNALGVVGVVLFYVIGVVLIIAPLVILGLPWWANVLIILITFIPIVGNVVGIGISILALTVAIKLPINATSIIFFISFAINIVVCAITIISAIAESRYNG